MLAVTLGHAPVAALPWLRHRLTEMSVYESPAERGKDELDVVALQQDPRLVVA